MGNRVREWPFTAFALAVLVLIALKSLLDRAF
jgi:hypothetical protein